MDAKDVVKRVTEQVQETANVKVVFGEPVKEEKVTVIPVASTKVSGGGGGGLDKKKDSGGMGMGLSMQTTPIGYIKVEDGQAVFEDIIDKTKVVQTAGTVLAFFLGLVTLGRMRAGRRARKMERREAV